MSNRRKFADGGDGREMASKRQRTVDPGYVSHPLPVVRLCGLPFDCTGTDVENFLHGIDIVDVLFVHNKGGLITGEVFCVLGYPLQVDYALRKNRQNMGKRYVEVFRSTRQQYYKAIAKEVAIEKELSVARGGSPRRSAPQAKEVTIERELSDARGGSPRQSAPQAKEVTIEKELSDARGGAPRRSAPRAKSYDERKDSSEHTGVLQMKGLPYSATKNDILEFFKDFALSEDSIHIVMNSEGRATGEAYVEFENAEDSKAAMTKDRMTIGHRYIELYP